MKKILSALIAAVVLSCLPAFADVGCYDNGTYNPSIGMFQGLNHCGPTTDINWLSQSGSAQNTQVGMIRSVPVVDNNLFAAGVAQGDYTSVPSTTTAVPVGYTFIRKVVDSDGNAAFTAGTLANGYPGQILTIYVAGLSPSNAVTGGNYTITPTLATGWATIKLSAVNDVLTLMFVDNTVGWVIMSYNPGASNSITISLHS